MMDKIWQVAERKFDDLLTQILYNRGIIDEKADKSVIKKFLEPNFADLHDPYLLSGVKKAVDRLVEAKEKGEKIGIFADYDADGVPGAALLYRGFRKIGFSPEVYIPNRESGYGLSPAGIDYLISKKCSLIVTVDLGIRSFAEAIYCKEKGIDLVITDHHVPDEAVPEAYVVIDAKQKGDRYPFKELCGCGVAFKLLQALSQKFPSLDEKFLKWNLDLVGISTISDVVPLINENRVLAKYGLIVNQKTKNLGLSELIKTTKIEPRNIDAYALGFQIGPRINAAGRIDHATKSFELLVTNDPAEAAEMALWLDEKNTHRQDAMERVIAEVDKQIVKLDLLKNKILIVAGDWQRGVIGPSASKIVEKYARPVILFAAGDEKFTGSARSVKNVDILALLDQSKEYIAKYGGHHGAAGLTVDAAQFTRFEAQMIQAAAAIEDEKLLKRIGIDCEIELCEASLKNIETIAKLEPFGMGNPRPVFMAKNVKLENARFVGKSEKHLSVFATAAGERLKSIYFNFPYEKSILEESVDIAFTLSVDEWNNDRKPSLNIVDVRLAITGNG
jgi:single-stranded-DNA-specific exonuclease